MKELPSIKVVPPGPKAREVLERDRVYISQSFSRYVPLVVERSEGSVVVDVDGNEYIDFAAGIATLNVGGAHPKVVGRIKEQVGKLVHYSMTDFYYESPVKLAEKLSEITPGKGRKKVFLANSGTEAIEAAIKLARWHTKRPQFIGFIGSFHGRTMGSLSFTSSKPVQRKRFFPTMPGVTLVPFAYCYRCPFKLSFPDCGYACVDYIREWVLEKFLPGEEVAGMLFEPIQGEGGYVVPPDGYFKELKKLSDEHGFLMIADEVQTGMGRTGKWFAVEHWGVEPDIIVMAKALASGMPLGAMVAREEVVDWEHGSHATTFGGNPVSCESAIATIETIEEENLVERAGRVGRELVKRLEEVKEENEIVGDVRGKGLMIGVELVKDKETKKPAVKEAKEVMEECFKRGLVVITAGKSTLRICPPLNIPEELLEKGVEIIEESLDKVWKGAR